RVMEITMPVLLLIMNISILGVLWFGSIQVNTGSVQVGEIVAIVNYATRITGAFSIFSFIIMAFSRARASSNRIVDVLDTHLDLSDHEDVNPLLAVTEGKVEFREVSFQYPGTHEPVLEKINFIVQPRQ